MSRVQLAINVSNIDEAVSFYSKLFESEPAKRRPGYANFAIADPPLKLVLIENPDDAGSLNHLGVEVSSTQEVVAATRQFEADGMGPRVEDGVECCYALQDKVWVTGVDGEPWEIYTKLSDVEMPEGSLRSSEELGEAECCGSKPLDDSAKPVTACC